MKVSIIKNIFLYLAIGIIISCSSNNKSNIAVIGVAQDINTLNPLYVANETEANISELMFLGLVGHKWNNERGEVEHYPILAETITWKNDSNSVQIKIKRGIKWVNGSELTINDVIKTFELYSDKVVQSRFYGSFNNFYLNDDLSININKSFSRINDYEFLIHFIPERNVSCFDFDFPILPEYLFANIDRAKLHSTSELKVVGGTGPYKVKEFKHNQRIVVDRNEKSFLFAESQISELVFKIIPDYNSRLYQFENKEIDFLEDVNPKDLERIKMISNALIFKREAREYDYLGFNLSKDELFSDKELRKAIATGINTNSIIEEYFLGNAKQMSSPISPIFKNAVNKEIEPTGYDLNNSKNILHNDGWVDNNNDGIVEKSARKLEFEIAFPAGNPLREYTAIRIKNNLTAIGAEVKLKPLEPTVFFEKMFIGELSCWIAGWSVPIPIDIKSYWHSDKQIAQGNVYNFKNNRADEIIEFLNHKISAEKRIELVKVFQKIISEEQPVVFLFWIDKLVAVNSRILNVDVNPLATIQRCWEWKIAND